ncbi:hypothetical protein U9M48_003394 [Paspalum notatum var. saurae]|uniref:Alpha-ketoglutarate-dependent dioxygenase AlkB-like domain-containing protein n=1 Tax=Paspalum notatum var. saurae TaxID=547442 RepID=A0AAQ3SI60_PASNO
MIAQTANSTANEFPQINPDVCIVNYYTNSGKLGLHQDKDESESSLTKGLPFISISIGDTAEFLFGNTRDKDQATKINLESGTSVPEIHDTFVVVTSLLIEIIGKKYRT